MGRAKKDLSLKIRNDSDFWHYKIAGQKNFSSTGIRIEYRRGQPTNRAEALRFAERRLLEKEAQERSGEDPTLNRYAAGFYIHGTCPILEAAAFRHSIKESTRKMHRQKIDLHIMPAWGSTRLSQIGGRKVEQWLMALDCGNSQRNHILQTFRAILRQAVLDGHIEANPLDALKGFSQVPKNPKTALTETQIEKLFPKDTERFTAIWKHSKFEYEQRTESSFAWHGAMFYLMLTTGMRSAEIRALKWSNVLFDDNAVIVEAQIDKDGHYSPPKKNEYRAVPLFSGAKRLMYKWYQAAKHREPIDYVFTNTGKPLASKRIQEYLRDAAAAAGVTYHITPHAFRHTFVSRASTVVSESGGEQALVQSITGHRSQAMHDHYDHPGRNELIKRMRPAVDRLSGASW